MKIVLSAGHTISGAGSGAVGYVNESIETRKVTKIIRSYLELKGHTVIDATIDKAKSQSDYLSRAVQISNNVKDSDLFVQVHFNAGGGNGCECYTWRGAKVPAAVGVCSELNKVGFRNRGVKDGSGLYVIRKTVSSAVLIEVCFCDNLKDVNQYKKLGVNAVAKAIANGIVNKM